MIMMSEMDMSPKLPGTYVNLLVDFIEKKGIVANQLLNGAGIAPHLLQAPFWYIDFNIFNDLLVKAAHLTNEPALSLKLAQEMKISCYGSVGVAAYSSENLGDALQILEKYIGLYCSVFKPKLKVTENKAYLYFHQPSPEVQLNAPALLFLIFGFVTISQSLVEQQIIFDLEFSHNKPDFYQAIKNENFIQCHFNCQSDGISFNKALLNLPLKSADQLTARLALAQCEKDIKKHISKRSRNESMSLKVKSILYDEVAGFLSLEQVATQLIISERSLQRQLANEQTTFQMLVAEVKCEQAERLLKQQTLSIKEIAYRLGYAEVSHFSRAFKNWTHISPKLYRDVANS